MNLQFGKIITVDPLPSTRGERWRARLRNFRFGEPDPRISGSSGILPAQIKRTMLSVQEKYPGEPISAVPDFRWNNELQLHEDVVTLRIGKEDFSGNLNAYHNQESRALLREHLDENSD
jgi:hypothetical protein